MQRTLLACVFFAYSNARHSTFVLMTQGRYSSVGGNSINPFCESGCPYGAAESHFCLRARLTIFLQDSIARNRICCPSKSPVLRESALILSDSDAEVFAVELTVI